MSKLTKRKDGFYVCQVTYDMARAIFWYDAKDNVFWTCGNDGKYPPSDFDYISKDPIDEYAIGSEDMEEPETWVTNQQKDKYAKTN